MTMISLRWRYTLISAALVAVASSLARAQESPEAAIRRVLESQVAAWNRGDIESFMEGYERSPGTTFVSGETITRGWQTVLERYRKNYGSREKMGTLSFSEIEVRPLGETQALVLGRWHLARAADAPHGRFTLIFQKTERGWRIIHDHTSAAP